MSEPLPKLGCFIVHVPDVLRAVELSGRACGVLPRFLHPSGRRAGLGTGATALDRGAEQVVAPTVKPWGQTIASVRELDGVLVELCSAMGT